MQVHWWPPSLPYDITRTDWTAATTTTPLHCGQLRWDTLSLHLTPQSQSRVRTNGEAQSFMNHLNM